MNARKGIDLRFEGWLLRETGIEASTLGVNALGRAVLERARAAHADGRLGAGPDATAAAAAADPAQIVSGEVIDAYWQWLNASGDEQQALVELLVVPETWFFRDCEAFVALVRLANERLVREPARALSVLSVPCSSGEEPYSIAMALLDAGIGPERFAVDALDISARAIEFARKAVYGRNSFRGHALAFRDRHFTPAAGGHRLNECVQQRVRFIQANLFDAPQNPHAHYNFIFCRNVLIYFDRDAQDRAIRLLDAQLAPGGSLFVGPAETGLMMRHALSSVRIPLAFAFQRTPADQSPPGGPLARTPQAMPAPRVAPAAEPAAQAGAMRPRAPVVASPSMPRAAAAEAPSGTPPAHAPEKPSASLADARRLADAGRLDEAERVADECIVVYGPDAAAFYLLGLIADARGRSAEAGDYYRKALYLEPGHYEALTHLAALLEMAGDRAGAERHLRRAQRAAVQAPQASQASQAPAPHVNQTRGFHGTRRR
ncbi:MAG TPA: CheR family methyltransferase [Paraburkholderia sp.]|jgi:chemotaxis protein methyltransferase WspC